MYLSIAASRSHERACFLCVSNFVVKLLLGWGANRNATAEVVGDAPIDNAKFFDKKKPVEIAKCQGLDELAMLF